MTYFRIDRWRIGDGEWQRFKEPLMLRAGDALELLTVGDRGERYRINFDQLVASASGANRTGGVRESLSTRRCRVV